MTQAPAVLIACDKFKGTLSASEACAAVAAGLRQIWPAASMVMRPMADGGEGTARVICDACDGDWVTTQVTGPMGEKVKAGWAWLAETKTAIIEMSEASGLRLVAPERRNPWRATTRGTGELMRAAMLRGAEKLVVGIGGSATNDGGAGMAGALGFRFLDENGAEIEPQPAALESLARILRPGDLRLPAVVAACDVNNPLLGPQGATAVYGPQKGVRLERIPAFEAGLAHLADVVKRDLGVDLAERPGAGAAGGLGFGLMAFCGAKMEPGFDLVARVTGLESAVRAADIVITGEGCVDAQTLNGKGPAGVAGMARRLGKPVVAVGGLVDEEARSGLDAVFHAVIAAATRDNMAEAVQAPAEFVQRAVAGAGERLAELLGY